MADNTSGYSWLRPSKKAEQKKGKSQPAKKVKQVAGKKKKAK